MLENIREIIINVDHTIWRYVNATWHNDFLDAIIPYFRNQWTWAPLYLFLLVFMLSNFKWKGLFWCLFFLGTFAISDQLSARFLKPIFERLRPCNHLDLKNIVHIIVPCGSGYSFPSSHAANHFALAFFSAITLQKSIKYIWWIAMFWAASVSFAQVYVGVHFPLDVFGGGIIGVIVGMITARLFNYFIARRGRD